MYYTINLTLKLNFSTCRTYCKIEGINTESIVGTGPNGKVMKADIMSVLNGTQKLASSKAEVAPKALKH